MNIILDNMGPGEIKFVYVESDGVLVAKGEGSLDGIIVQGNSIDELKKEIKDTFCAYIDMSVDPILRQMTQDEWDDKNY